MQDLLYLGAAMGTNSGYVCAYHPAATTDWTQQLRSAFRI